ncbi:PepSY domain-containing protein [Thiopseudomonas alkaliphila]|uniref:PepSY domain-containing protein n=1 Tax=Thiopseudomonas alkaliphila TaxID=1697053 RepID=UPI0025777E9A|nr:PepSY domain-containing protein [Thiopseudomonas alkaliphila]MDM1717189.1 PepSY domain-containing protein [Thiopseudomonas alkaliphila]
MNKLMTLTTASIAALALSAGLAQARDLTPEEINQLTGAGTIQSVEQLNQVVLEQHPGAEIYKAELEQDGNRYVYEVDLKDAQGVKWDLELDAANGQVLKNKQDD